jgi:serine/threonine protein kinase/WD40 repeat protein
VKTVNVIEAVFFAALDKNDAAERAQYLDQACNGDPDLRRCVEKLLAAQPRVGEFLQAPAPGLPAAAAPETVDHLADERPGTILGPYKLLHEIGEGGMGTVWMAEQSAPVKRRVALKVIKPGMDSRQVLARFEAERQALALMDHPNIAKVLNAGATPPSSPPHAGGTWGGGRPYFVMELVKGQPITEFCDKNRLSTRERLDLFVSVCNAIQHAHQKGIIHRDIKPSNVLVALYDGKPVPKVIDFGVAKAVGDPLTDKTLFTRHGQVIGTFEYMSPEQATLDQVDIDTRSDVYSLGVLLYELLTGTTPLDKDELRKGGLAEVLRRIREVEPPKPSTRLTSSPGLLASVAAHRKSDSQKLPRAVRGELDWIVMKALDKDRNRRFATANGLAADVERYLKDEPVQACPPTLGYRMRKWIRKNKVAFATTSAIAAALVIGIALASWQAVRATKAERETAAALLKADDDRDQAIKLSQQLDTQLGETNAAYAKYHAAQDQQRANQYAWDIRGLSLIWESGNTVEAKHLLERQPERLRGFEWRYWDNVLHSEILSTRLQAEQTQTSFPEWIFCGDGSHVALFQWPIRGLREGRPEERQEKKIILTVWELATQRVVRTHRFAAAPDAPGFGRGGRGPGFVRLSHDGKRVLLTQPIYSQLPNDRSELRGSRVEVFDIDRDRVLFSRSFQKESPLFMDAGAVCSLDGRKLAVGLQTREREQGGGIQGKLVSSEIKVFDLDAGDKELLTIPDVRLRFLSDDGSRIVSVPPGPDTFPIATPPKLEYKVWDAGTGKELLRFEAPAIRHASPDEKELFDVVLADGEKSDRLLLKSYSAETGKERLSIPLPFPATRNPRNIANAKSERVYSPLVAMAFSRDGSQLLVGNRPSFASLAGASALAIEVGAVIDVATGTIRATVDNAGSRQTPFTGFGSGSRAQQPFFTADGKQFVLTDDNVIRTFDSTTGKPVLTLRGHDNDVVACAEGPDGRLWSIEADGTLKQWSLRRTEPLRLAAQPVRGGTAGIPFALSADGAWVARAHAEPGAKPDEETSIVEVWDTAGKEEARVFQKVGVPRGVQATGRITPTVIALSADGRRVAMIRMPAFDAKTDKQFAPADLTVWDVASREEIFQIEFPESAGTNSLIVATMPMFSADGATVAVVQRTPTQHMLRLFDINNRREKPAIQFGKDDTARVVRLSPDGQRVAAVLMNASAADFGFTTKVVLCEVATGTQREIAARVTPTTSQLAFSPDGTRLLVTYRTSNEYGIDLYDTATGKQVASLYNPDRGGGSGFSPAFPDPAGPVFSPDGRRVAGITFSGQTAVIKVWDAESGKDLLTLPAPPLARGPLGRVISAIHLAFTPDNNRLVAVATNGRPRVFGSADDAQAVPPITVTIYDATPRPGSASAP